MTKNLLMLAWFVPALALAGSPQGTAADGRIVTVSQESPVRLPGDYLSTLDEAERRFQARLERNVTGSDPSLSHDLSVARAAVGNYDGAIEGFRVIGSRTPRAGGYEAEVKELLASYGAANALAAIVQEASSRQIVILNEAHHVPRHRAFALLVARELRKLGYEYLACEAFSRNVEGMTVADHPTGATGSYVKEPLFADFVRQSLRLGYRPIPYEHSPRASSSSDPSTQINDREAGQARNLVERIFAKDPKAKVFIYVGYSHLKKKPQVPQSGGSLLWMAARLKAATGIEPLTIDQTTLSDPVSGSKESEILKQVFESRSSPKPLVLHARSWHQYLAVGPHADDVDMQILHPPPRQVDGRPDWLGMDGYRAPYCIPKHLLPQTGRRLVQAYVEGEGYGAVPVDQVIVTADDKHPSVLMLPRGKFRLEFQE